MQQHGGRQLAPTVNTHMQNVFGIKFEIQPRAAIGNNTGRKQQLARHVGFAFVMVEKHARAAVHLRNDDALGAIDDKGAVFGHEWQVAHIDFLLFNILDRFRAGFVVNVENNQTQRHFQRCRIGHAALLAFLDIVFRALKIIGNKFQHGCAAEIGDWKHGFENRLQTVLVAAFGGRFHLQKLII